MTERKTHIHTEKGHGKRDRDVGGDGKRGKGEGSRVKTWGLKERSKWKKRWQKETWAGRARCKETW